MPELHTPSSILTIFDRAINIREEKSIIYLKGVYHKTGMQAYGGYYYDELKEASNNCLLRIKIPQLIRDQIVNKKEVEFKAFISRKVNNRSSIDILCNVTELLQQKENQFSDQEIKSLEVQQLKSSFGYKNVEELIKNKIFIGDKISVAIVMGANAIIDQDIHAAFDSGFDFYELSFHKTNLSVPNEIAKTVQQLDLAAHEIICIARGGGNYLDVFNQAQLAEKLIRLNSILLTAIGHADNNTLVEKIADKKFITPTAFGNFLSEIYEETMASQQNSQARLIKEVENKMRNHFSKEISLLNNNLQKEKVLFERTKQEREVLFNKEINSIMQHAEKSEKFLKDEIRNKEETLKELKSNQSKSSLFYLLIAFIFGLMLAFLFMKF